MTSMEAPAHGDGSRSGLIPQLGCGAQGQGPSRGASTESPPSHFVSLNRGQAGLPGVLSLPQVIAETLYFKQAQLKGYNQNTTLFLSASIL